MDEKKVQRIKDNPNLHDALAFVGLGFVVGARWAEQCVEEEKTQPKEGEKVDPWERAYDKVCKDVEAEVLEVLSIQYDECGKGCGMTEEDYDECELVVKELIRRSRQAEFDNPLVDTLDILGK